MPYKDQEVHKKYWRDYYRKNTAIKTARNKVYYALLTPEKKERLLSQRRAWYAVNKSKWKCYTAVAKAIKIGVLKKPDKCSKCGVIGYVEGHHSDYTKPLNVDWLCCLCHRAANPNPKRKESVCTDS